MSSANCFSTHFGRFDLVELLAPVLALKSDAADSSSLNNPDPLALAFAERLLDLRCALPLVSPSLKVWSIECQTFERSYDHKMLLFQPHVFDLPVTWKLISSRDLFG